MKNKNMSVVFTILILLFSLSCIYPQFPCDSLIGFEYTPRDTFGLNYDIAGSLIFNISNIDVYIDSMSLLAGGKSYLWAYVEPPFCGFGAGKIMHLNNVSLIFDLSQYNTNRVSFIFMDLGGDENLQVNGDTLYIVSSLRQIPSTAAPGVTCIIDSIGADTCDFGGLIGRVNLNGTINELLIAGQELWIDSLCIDVVDETSIPDNSDSYQPKEYFLRQNYPNPFNSSTKITYSIPRSGFVILKVFDILGKEIHNLVSEYQNANTYSINFEAEKFPSGIYYYKLQVANYVEIKKMLLIR